MAVFLYQDSQFIPLEQSTFQEQGILERTNLQAALRDLIEVICPDCLVIAEEFAEFASSRRRIDLLAVDRDANLVVVELKRTETGEHMELQAIRYAAMVSTLTFKKAVEIFGKYLQSRGSDDEPEVKLLEFLGVEDSADLNFPSGVRITLASADFSKELTTSVMWLRNRGIDLRCVRMVPYAYEEKTLIDVQQIIPLPEAEDYSIGVQEQSEERRTTRQAAGSYRDFTKYQFKGSTYSKRRLILAVVTHRFKSNQPNEADELFEAFPQEIRHGSGDLFERLEDVKDTNKERNFFTEENEIFKFSNGDTYVLYNHWGLGDNWDDFLKKAKSLNYEIEEEI